MKSKFLLFTAALFILLNQLSAQTPEFVMDNVTKLAVSNGKLFLEASDAKKEHQGLWVSDGTATGSKFLKEFRTPQETRYVECNGLTYFMAEDAETYAELWATDGTTAGTYLVKKLKPAKSGAAKIMVSFNNKLYFIGNDLTHGEELWASDGTESGTKLFKDINPGTESSFIRGYETAIVYKNKMYFNARHEINNEELWVSDGTGVGTKLFKDINSTGSSNPGGLSTASGKMYFSAYTENEGNELWVSDGTDSGTHLVKDISPKEERYSPKGIIEYDGKAYFTVLGYIKPFQVWSTDGTEAGTTLVEDRVGQEFTIFNGDLYFGKIIGSGGTQPLYNYALYKTKGKPAGGNLVKVISGDNSSYAPENFVQANGKLYFLCTINNWAPHDLWETDGTTANTKLVEYSPGILVDVNDLNGLKAYNNALYFTDLNSKLYRIGTPNTAVAEIAHNNFEMALFPNPANKQITIKTVEKLIGSDYAVLNSLGQTVRSGKITNDNTLLEVGDLPGGSYFVRVQLKDGNSVSRFVKE